MILVVSRSEQRNNRSILDELHLEREVMSKVAKLKLQYFEHDTTGELNINIVCTGEKH